MLFVLLYFTLLYITLVGPHYNINKLYKFQKYKFTSNDSYMWRATRIHYRPITLYPIYKWHYKLQTKLVCFTLAGTLLTRWLQRPTNNSTYSSYFSAQIAFAKHKEN